jgi:hypothetical protein
MDGERVIRGLTRGIATTALVLAVAIGVRLAMGHAILWDWVAIVAAVGVAGLTLLEWLH